jgi:hypothetical protein
MARKRQQFNWRVDQATDMVRLVALADALELTKADVIRRALRAECVREFGTDRPEALRREPAK